jgi:RNA polymerase sigma factor (sigma-70 family)
MESIQSGGNPKMSEATDEQLFALMAERGEDAKEAWKTFYLRYINDLHRLVYRLNGVLPSDINDLVQETMIKAWESAHTFKGGSDGNTDIARRRTLAWLCCIAKNHYWGMRRRKIILVSNSEAQKDGHDSTLPKDEVRRRDFSKLHHEIKKAVDGVTGTVDVEVDAVSVRKLLLQEALKTLPEREREIVLSTFEHYEPGQQQQRRLPKEAVNKICQSFEITPDNLRQIRKRAYEKLERYVGERLPAETKR